MTSRKWPRAEGTAGRPQAPGTAAPRRGVPTGDPGPLMRVVKDQRVLFLLVGGANTAFSTGMFIMLALYFPDTPSAVLLTVAWAVSLVTVFFVYRRLVFRVSGHLLRDFFRFVLVNLSSLLINITFLFLASDVLGYPRIPSQIAITVVSVVVSYFGHRYFSFRRTEPEDRPEKRKDSK
jgi:putative flippase GtrA